MCCCISTQPSYETRYEHMTQASMRVHEGDDLHINSSAKPREVHNLINTGYSCGSHVYTTPNSI
jgi:hypothetical protein